MKEFQFDGLFILDMANNHQGDLEHGLNIIRGIGDVVERQNVRGALKFQFRHLDTFIHPDYRERDDVKHIPRFISTALSTENYAAMTQAVKEAGLHTICTPFDEVSVNAILDLDIEIIKIASCSADDRPLLEKVANTGRPVVASTAGLSMNRIDRLASFFEYKNVDFALMHCIALYPTPNNALNLNQIAILKDRFPQCPIGFSTHEDPENYQAIQIAFARGACLFERHVGMEDRGHTLNKYSSTPQQVERWITAYKEAVEACGSEHRPPATPEERVSLRSLMRGVFAKKDITKGTPIERDDVFFAMPLHPGQMRSGEWRDGLISDNDYTVNAAISEEVATQPSTDEELIYTIMLQIKGMLNKARIYIGKTTSVELSHHYGLARFREFGAVIVNCINRAYCKKLIILLPRQKHPYHYHSKKEETFQLLQGDLEVELNGQPYRLGPGDTFLVKPKDWHKFHSLHGAIFEEVSTTHYNNDSFYEDETIARLPREARKTIVSTWNEMMIPKSL